MAISPAEDWQSAIDKLQAGVDKLDRNGGDGTITFAFDAPGRPKVAVELTREKAVAIIGDMKKEKLLSA